LFVLSCSKPVPNPAFPILAWDEPPVGQWDRPHFRELKEAGFTHFKAPSSVHGQNQANLDLGLSVGLRGVISDNRLSQALRDSNLTVEPVARAYESHPSFWGYALPENPSQPDFYRLGGIVDTLNQADPRHHIYAMLPSKLSGSMMGDPDRYQTYLTQFLEVVQPDVIDIAPSRLQSVEMPSEYYSTLERARRLARMYEISFWATIWAKPTDTPVVPSLSFLRIQVFSALAYGANGLRYDFHDPLPSTSDSFENPNAISQTLHDRVTRINAEVQAWGAVLNTLTPRTVLHTPPVPPNCTALNGNAIISTIEGRSILVGLLNDDEDQLFMLLVNRNMVRGQQIRVIFSQVVKSIREVAKPGRIAIEQVWSKTQEDRWIEMIFKAGEGRLFQLGY
jgi:hypothetical protein